MSRTPAIQYLVCWPLASLPGVFSSNEEGLRDAPLGAAHLQYLDGSDWRAECVPSRTRSCTFEEDVDFDIFNTSTIGQMLANTQQECCEACWARPGCAGAVFLPPNCYAKDAWQLRKKTRRPGRMACLRSAAPPAPPAPCLGGQIPAVVPGDLLSDLQREGRIDDPLFELNFRDPAQKQLWMQDWLYSKTFKLDDKKAAAGALLVLDGVKMGARVLVDGIQLGTISDQFLRYIFPLAAVLETGIDQYVGRQHNLTVVFDKWIPTDGRYMACTGGWDWAPYTRSSMQGANLMSKGIVKSVYIAYPQAEAASAFISAVVPLVRYLGKYPAAPLSDSTMGDFEVRVRVHILSSKRWRGQLQVAAAWSSKIVKSALLDLPDGESNHTLTIAAPAKSISLWWPVGLGDRPLYNVSVCLRASSDGPQTADVVRRIGFRVVALVTGNDTDPDWVAANTGLDGTADPPLGMRFRVNGAAILARGANLVPMDEMEGRNTAMSHRALVRSVAEASMNMLRIWGGGIYQYDAFYDACDEHGILIYHDIQYAQAHGPSQTQTQADELRHQVRRLSHHPSIVLFDGCNECLVPADPLNIYNSFVLKIVAEEDPSRVIWPSSPGDGWKSGVDRLYSMPNGKPLLSSGTHDRIEVHGPYNWASGRWPAVNGGDDQPPTSLNSPGESHCRGVDAHLHGIGCRGWGTNYSHIPITNLSKVQSGISLPNRFSSEGGTVVMSSFESMSPTLKPQHWGLHGGAPPDHCTGGGFGKSCDGSNVMAERNYPCDDLIWTFFGDMALASLNEVGEVAFKRQLYQCQLSQALLMSQTLSVMRAKNWAPAYPQNAPAASTMNTFGILVWMLNEIWPTGGWGSLEYGNAKIGSIIGGRWKPLQYLYRKTLYTDQFATCSTTPFTDSLKEFLCVVTNDSPFAFSGDLRIVAIDLSSGMNTSLKMQPLQMEPGAGVSEWYEVTARTELAAHSTVLVITITNSNGKGVHENLIPLTSPSSMRLHNVSVTLQVQGLQVKLFANKPAMYVFLTTAAQGRFSDNCFLLRGERIIEFVPFMDGQEEKLRDTTRVEHLYNHQQPSWDGEFKGEMTFI